MCVSLHAIIIIIIICFANLHKIKKKEDIKRENSSQPQTMLTLIFLGDCDEAYKRWCFLSTSGTEIVYRSKGLSQT